METMKFKTNAKCGGCEAAMRMKLHNIINDNQWTLDLNSADKILEVTADVSPAMIIEAVADAGFKAEQIV